MHPEISRPFPVSMLPSIKRLRRKPKPVTLIVGIICKDGIVVAGDSQTTNLSTRMARTDGSKIYNITLSDGASGIVATAGSVEWSLQIVERVERLAKQAELKSERSFADLVETANIEIKQKERLVRRPSRELKQHFDDYETTLLIANYFRRKPCMYTLHSNRLVSPTRVTNQLYTTIGNSAAMADYILRKFDIPTTLSGVAHGMAIYTINEIIMAKDTSCYYPIQAAHVWPYDLETKTGESTAMLFDQGQMADELKIVGLASAKIESELKRGMWAACLTFVDILEKRGRELEEERNRLAQEIERLQRDAKKE
jgi:20S proteasome alpha/beta subunit